MALSPSARSLLQLALLLASVARSSSATPPASWPDAPAARAYWPELGGLPLAAPPPFALAGALAVTAAPALGASAAALATVVALDLAGPAVAVAWATAAAVADCAPADYSLLAPRPVVLASTARGAVAGVGATLRRVRSSPPDRAAIGLVGVAAAAGGAQAWTWTQPASHNARLVAYAAAAPGEAGRDAAAAAAAASAAAAIVVVLFTASDAAGATSLLVTSVDAASGASAQAAPFNLTALGPLAGCGVGASPLSDATDFVLSADGATALISALFGPFSACLVAVDVASGAALWAAPTTTVPAWPPAADPADASQALLWAWASSGSGGAGATLSAVGFRDGAPRWAATLPRNESGVVGLDVAAGTVFIAATYLAGAGCPIALTRVYAFGAATGAPAAAPFSLARFPDVGAQGALVAAAVAGGGAGAAASAMLYVRGAGAGDAAAGLDSYLSALSFNGSALALTHDSRGADTGVGVAGVAAACRRGDTGYAPSGTLLVGPRDGQLLLADAQGIVLLGAAAAAEAEAEAGAEAEEAVAAPESVMAPAPAPGAGAPAWAAVGVPVARSGLAAASLAFDDGASDSDDGVPPFPAGTPLLAVGATDAGSGDTTTDFLRLDAASGAWAKFASHTPQFAQSYTRFSFRFALGRVFLGLAIPDDSISSVLRSGRSGSDGEFEGCYAFDGLVFGFAVNGDGDMRLASVDSAGRPALSTYNRSGWAQYPASDAFGPSTPLPPPRAGANTSGVAVVADAGGRDAMLIALSSPAGVAGAAGAAGAAATVRVHSTTLSNSTRVAAVGGVLLGAQAAIALGGAAAEAVACVSLFDADSALRVFCVDASASAPPGAEWADLGATDDAGDAAVAPAVAVSPSRLVAAAARSRGGSTVLVALCQLPAASVGDCVGGWTQAPIVVAGSAPVQAVELSVGAGGQIFACVRTSGDVQVFALSSP